MINPRIKIRRFDLPNGISGHLAAEDGFIFSASGFEKDAPDDADMLHWHAYDAEEPEHE